MKKEKKRKEREMEMWLLSTLIQSIVVSSNFFDFESNLESCEITEINDGH